MSKHTKAAGTAGGEDRRVSLFEGVIDGCSLAIGELDEEKAREVCQWKYDGDYAVYNLSNWQTAKFLHHGITDERRRRKEFRSLLDGDGCFIGYFRLFREEPDSITLTIGMEPSHCSLGLGRKVMELIKRYAAKKYPGKKLLLSVRGFNRRAVRCFTGAGFQTQNRFLRETPSGTTEIFLEMECVPQPDAGFLGISDTVPEPEAKGGSKRKKK